MNCSAYNKNIIHYYMNFGVLKKNIRKQSMIIMKHVNYHL